VFDPMMGGGTTLHEAVRLEANVIGNDIDPMPFLQARATLTPIELDLLRINFAELHEFISLELRPLFQTNCPSCDLDVDLQFMLYGLFQECSCVGGIYLDSFKLRTQPDGTQLVICSRCHYVGTEKEEHRCSSGLRKTPIYLKGSKNCPICGGTFQQNLLKPYYTRYKPVAVACRCLRHGFQLAAVSQRDMELLQQADHTRSLLIPENTLDVGDGPKTKALLRKGIHHYEDLFSSRQIIYITRASKLTSKFDELIGLNLGLLVSTSLDLNSMLCGYKGTAVRRAGAVRHVFSHHAYSFPHTALENNPIYPAKISGSLKRLFSDRIERGKKWSLEPRERVVDKTGIKFIQINGELDLG